MDWINLLQTLGGVLAGVSGLGLFNLLTRNGRARDRADADLKVQEAQRLMIENYEERIKDLHESIKTLNDSEQHYISRLSEQNKALNSKVEQIRSLTQKMWESEQELNRANERVTRLTEERDNYRNWHCRKGDCPHREPPNPRLHNQTFDRN